VGRVLAGEPIALHFYGAHRDELVSYAAKIVGDHATADDIVQDAWLGLSRAEEDVRILDPKAYLRRAIRNLAIDALRRKARQQRIGGEMPEAEIAHDAPSPEQASIARADLRCVAAVLQSLPERQRIAIEMYRFDDYKLREIAAHLGVSIALVHKLIADGLALCAERCGIGRD
jgi:RNA polymerase sigma factor (sigma-70 family)